MKQRVGLIEMIADAKIEVAPLVVASPEVE
jgi:hypothetical protein